MLLTDFRRGKRSLDLLRLEGCMHNGPVISGGYDPVRGEPITALVDELAAKASIVGCGSGLAPVQKLH